MPTYTAPVGINSTAAKVAISGTPAYFYGSLNQDQQDMQAQITSIACTSNVATIAITIEQGNIPAVGNLIWVRGVTTAAYNVSGVAIASVTAVSAAAGTYTLTYACTTADLSTAAASGKAVVPVPEVAEAVAANQSVAIYVPSQEPVDNGVRSITVATTFPTIQATTGAATVTLYTAINNNGIPVGTTGTEWTSMGVVATVAAGAQTVGPLKTFTTPAGRWFCLVVSGVTGTNTLIAKMLS